MTRELKLALIVGFALVLVVTVLISDHLSHARQTELAGNVPAEPIKVAEPPTIAMGNDPAPAPVSPAPANTFANNIPAQAPTGMGITDPTGGPAYNNTPEPQPLVINNGRNGSSEHADLFNKVRELGGDIREGNIIVGPPAAAQTVKQPLTGPITGPAVPSTLPPIVPSPVTTTPDRIHTVVAGDSTFKIAKQYYGDGKVWRKLVRYNKMEEEGTLKIGTQVKIPSAEVLLGKKTPPTMAILPANTGGLNRPMPTNGPAVNPIPRTTALPVTPVKIHTYTVKKGDTLAQIAQRELGTTKRAHEIVELNPRTIKDPDNVPLGAVLTLPAA